MHIVTNLINKHCVINHVFDNLIMFNIKTPEQKTIEVRLDNTNVDLSDIEELQLKEQDMQNKNLPTDIFVVYELGTLSKIKIYNIFRQYWLSTHEAKISNSTVNPPLAFGDNHVIKISNVFNYDIQYIDNLLNTYLPSDVVWRIWHITDSIEHPDKDCKDCLGSGLWLKNPIYLCPACLLLEQEKNDTPFVLMARHLNKELYNLISTRDFYYDICDIYTSINIPCKRCLGIESTCKNGDFCIACHGKGTKHTVIDVTITINHQIHGEQTLRIYKNALESRSIVLSNDDAKTTINFNDIDNFLAHYIQLIRILGYSVISINAKYVIKDEVFKFFDSYSNNLEAFIEEVKKTSKYLFGDTK